MNLLRTVVGHLKTLTLLGMIITGDCLLIYVTVQQVYRQSANDPQIQLAEDGVREVLAGRAMELIAGDSKVDLQKSLAPFIVFYSDSGKPLFSSGFINGQFPVIPQGVLAYAKNHGENRVTW